MMSVSTLSIQHQYMVSIQKRQSLSFRQKPESTMSLNSLDPGMRRDDGVVEKHVFLDGRYIGMRKENKKKNAYFKPVVSRYFQTGGDIRNVQKLSNCVPV